MIKKRLLLTRETLRRLTEENARRVVGGATQEKTCSGRGCFHILTQESFCHLTPPFNDTWECASHGLSGTATSGPSGLPTSSAQHGP